MLASALVAVRTVASRETVEAAMVLVDKTATAEAATAAIAHAAISVSTGVMRPSLASNGSIRCTKLRTVAQATPPPPTMTSSNHGSSTPAPPTTSPTT